MYFCSICLNMYENTEAANMCYAIELPQWKIVKGDEKMNWFDERDDIETILNHLGSRVPDSIREDAERELRRRGWPEERIAEEKWKRTGDPQH
jgi:hypothetical protein